MYSLLCRHVNIGILQSRNAAPKASLSHSNHSTASGKESRLGKFFEQSITSRRILLFVAMLGMCMLIGDGILTPAISGFQIFTYFNHSITLMFPFSFQSEILHVYLVLSAMDGLRGPFPSVGKCKQPISSLFFEFNNQFCIFKLCNCNSCGGSSFSWNSDLSVPAPKIWHFTSELSLFPDHGFVDTHNSNNRGVQFLAILPRNI